MKLSKYIDHTLLKADATEEQIKMLCTEAKENDFASVCVNSCYAYLCAEQLYKSGVKVCCVVGFPLGAMSSAAKAYEASAAVADGAEEIDMVINIGKLKSKDFDYVKNDIASVVNAVHPKAIVKVIIETCLLTDEEKAIACRLAVSAGADFVKTSTGFSTAGATARDVSLMRSIVGSDIGVKAAGGIHSYEEAKAMIDAGATRIGASAGIAIISGSND